MCPNCEDIDAVETDDTGLMTCAECGSLVETDYAAMRDCPDCPVLTETAG